MNAFAISVPRNLTNVTSSLSDWLQKKPIFPDISCLRNRTNEPIFICCSTKPNIDRENTTDDDNYTVGPRSSSTTQEQATSGGRNPALSSSSSKGSSGLVLDLGYKDSWDSAEVGSPVVRRFLGDEEERWLMWYYGRSEEKRGSIGLAISRNGIHWERGEGAVKSSADVGLAMNCSSDWWAFDTQGIRPSEVVIMSSSKVNVNSALYWLYYTGLSPEKLELKDHNMQNPMRLYKGGGGGGGCGGEELEENGFCKSLPGLAMSQDGRHWARIEGEHHSGALFDVGSNGEWDSLFISSPQVVFHGAGDLRMYYHSLDGEKGHFSVGVARSRDGIKWVKLGKVLGGGAKGKFDELGVMNPRVVRERKEGRYVMVYEGVDANGGSSIGLAVSSDGLRQWSRYQECPLLMPSKENGWDCEGVGSPYLVQMNEVANEWRLYYEGTGEGGKTGIGLAVSQGNEFADFQRWTGFHL